MSLTDIVVYLFLLIGATLSYTKSKLTLAGAITGALVGLFIYKGAGYPGLVMLAAFFIAGSWATGWQLNKKTAIGAAEQHKGKRTVGQVLANGGTAALLGALGWYSPNHVPLVQLMVAGSFASAIADTFSSELGMIYGRRTFNILTLKKDQRGAHGVVSLEGTLIGVGGAAFIALSYSLFCGWSFSFLWIIIAGFTGNLLDSVLGASLERKGWIGNNVVNFLNTAVGAGVCWLTIINW